MSPARVFPVAFYFIFYLFIFVCTEPCVNMTLEVTPSLFIFKSVRTLKLVT